MEKFKFTNPTLFPTSTFKCILALILLQSLNFKGCFSLSAFGLGQAFYSAKAILGHELNTYFNHFDLVFGDFSHQLLDSNFPVHRETAHFQLSDGFFSKDKSASGDVGGGKEKEELRLKYFEVPRSRSSLNSNGSALGSGSDDETRSAQLAFILNLADLSGLDYILNTIREILLNLEAQSSFSIQHPHFFIAWQKLLSTAEQDGILSRGAELSHNLPLNSDVYLTFPSCLSLDEIPKNSTANSTEKYVDDQQPNGGDSGNATHFPDFMEFETRKTFEAPECPLGLAGIKLLEFYSVKGIGIVSEVKFKVGEKWEWTLAQKVIRRRNFKSANLATVAAYGYEYRAKFSPTNDSYESGYEADQIKFLGESFNMSVQAGVGTGWITVKPDMSLTGMGDQVLKGEADISISASEVLVYRARQLNFLHPTYYTKLWGFFVQPPSSSFRDIFIHAFTGDLWLTMLSTWTLIVCAMAALAVVKRRLDTMHENDTIIIQELFIWAAGAVCQQGWHICPESSCMKIIFIFALITGLVSYVAYSAALVSILSVKVVPVKNLDDIVSRGYTIYQDNQTINALYIIQNLESEGVIPCLPLEKRSIRSEVALPKILSPLSLSAFIGAADFFYPVAKGEMNDTTICNSISRISVSGRPVRGGMFIKKGSPLKDFFNHRLLIMYERGIRFRLLENYFRSSAVMCLEKTGATKDPLGFNDVYTAFVILVIGYCISILILVIERIFPPRYVIAPPTATDLNINISDAKGKGGMGIGVVGAIDKLTQTATSTLGIGEGGMTVPEAHYYDKF